MSDVGWNSEGDPIVVFDFGRLGDMWVLRRCVECGRFISEGYLQINGLEEVRAVGWECSRCGEVDVARGWI